MEDSARGRTSGCDVRIGIPDAPVAGLGRHADRHGRMRRRGPAVRRWGETDPRSDRAEVCGPRIIVKSDNYLQNYRFSGI